MSFQELKTIKDRRQFIRTKLETDKAWATRGLIRIFDNQTLDEQSSEATIRNNGIGFTPADAEFLTSLAKQFQSKGYLSPKQTVILHKRMPKYAAQLERECPKKEK
jgi:hypothetical protein